MPLKPLYDYERDAQGNLKKDRHGYQIPHKKAGQPKPYAEYSAAEKSDHDFSISSEAAHKKANAQRIVKEYDAARELLAQDSAQRGSKRP